jgi:ADP-ribose pyrophosphatase
VKFNVVDSEIIFQGRAFEVRRDSVVFPDERRAEFDLLLHPGAVTIVPVDRAGNVWFVNQYRHSTGGMLLELPAGTLNAGESPEDCARREVREEIGMSAEIRRLGAFYTSPGYSTEYMYVFLATGLEPDPLPMDADEFIAVVKFPLEQAYAMSAAGEINDAKTIAALALARPVLTEI